MAAEKERVARLETRAAEAETALQQLKHYVDLIRRKSADPDVGPASAAAQQLQRENHRLRGEVEQLKQQLVALEIRRGLVQVPLPSQIEATPTSTGAPPPKPQELAPPTEEKPDVPSGAQAVKKVEKGKKEKREKPAAARDVAMDVSRLDLRIGRFVSVKQHPDADTLYVEEVDIGEGTLRTVCSGLVKHIPIDELQDRMVLMLCNLKPAKMRGVMSEAMVMCASSPDKVEILDPPPGCTPGERVTCPGFTGTPDKQLNPKKKIFEQIQPELHTNEKGVACYRGLPFEVEDKGVCRAATMKNSGIK